MPFRQYMIWGPERNCMAVEQEDIVAPSRFFEAMCRHDDGSSVGDLLVYEVEDDLSRCHVEAGDGFIEE